MTFFVPRSQSFLDVPRGSHARKRTSSIRDSSNRRGSALVALLLQAAIVATAAPAHASGPVERVLQLLAHPRDPKILVLRYGAASHGFLFSRDGGGSFQAMCSEAVAPDLGDTDKPSKISFREVPSTAAVTIDSAGRILFSQYGSLWSDDGTGCSWSRQADFDGKNAYSIRTDPSDPAVVWAAVGTAETKVTADTQSRAELMRRDATGAWSVVGPLKDLGAGQAVLQGDLLVFADGTRTRLYSSMNLVDVRGSAQRRIVAVSDDRGMTWTEHELPVEQKDLTLLAVDPEDPDRVLAVIPREGAADALLLSEDAGGTFEPYSELRTVAGATFDAQGQLFVADFGDNSSAESLGGLYAAPRLGGPLAKVPNTQYIECVHHNALTNKLYVCNRDRFGVVDPTTGTFEQVLRLDQVASLLECPGVDMSAACKEQLNSGPSWCCAGHYPFTPFCGEYDVTLRPDGQKVFCGLAGREYDTPASTNRADDAGASADASGFGRDSGGSALAPEEDAAVDARQSEDDNASHPDAGTTVLQSKRNDGCTVNATNLRSDTKPPPLTTCAAVFAVLGYARWQRRRR